MISYTSPIGMVKRSGLYSKRSIDEAAELHDVRLGVLALQLSGVSTCANM